MRVASLLVLTFGAMLGPAFCQSRLDQAWAVNETSVLYAEAKAYSAEWKLFPSEVEGGSISGFSPASSPALLDITPITPSPATAVRNLVQPEFQKAAPRTMEWKFSLLALAAAHSADAATSWNKREMNPMLSPNSGAFGVQTLVLKCAITAGSIGLQAILLRRHPGLAKMFARMNFVESGVISATAIHNSFVPSR